MNEVTLSVKPTFYNYWNYRQTPEKNSGISLTEPDKTMTIDELFKKFASGQEMNVSLEQLFHGDDENLQVSDDFLQGVNFATLDISEKFDIIKNIDLNIDDLKKGMNTRRELELSKKAAQNAAQQAREKEVEEMLQSHREKLKLQKNA